MVDLENGRVALAMLVLCATCSASAELTNEFPSCCRTIDDSSIDSPSNHSFYHRCLDEVVWTLLTLLHDNRGALNPAPGQELGGKEALAIPSADLNKAKKGGESFPPHGPE